MDGLPDVVRVALLNAHASGRTLSWKVQENAKGTLIQLVWKKPAAETSLDSGLTDTVGSNLNKIAAKSDKPAENPRNKKRNNPSRVHRNARRLQSFLDRKRSSKIKSKLVSAY